MTIEWEELPANRSPGRRFDWDALDERPGEWAVYARDAKSSTGSSAYAKARGYEMRSRTNGDGTFTLYVRKPVQS